MLSPFLKWAGGKSWLIRRHDYLLPTSYNWYFEPFLGSGAVYFHLLPANAILSDLNAELINTFESVRDDVRWIDARLRRYQKQHSQEFYYAERQRQPRTKRARAAQFIYLNRTCFNGLYRVNQQGMFNVPIGTKEQVAFPKGYLEGVSIALRKATILSLDFEETINLAGKGDFVFVDPPYTVMHNTNNFIKYNAKLFSWGDQVRLAEAVRCACARGAKVLVTNADHPSISALYKGFGRHHHLERASVLSGNAVYRRDSTELVMNNY